MKYVKWPSKRPSRSSWHVLDSVLEARILTRCGRVMPVSPLRDQMVDELPADQKTCERCLVGVVRDVDSVEAVT